MKIDLLYSLRAWSAIREINRKILLMDRAWPNLRRIGELTAEIYEIERAWPEDSHPARLAWAFRKQMERALGKSLDPNES